MNGESLGTAADAERSAEAREIRAEVSLRLGGRVRDLRVGTRDGGLVLQGHCATYHEKQIVQEAAKELTALPILSNEIEVRSQPRLRR